MDVVGARHWHTRHGAQRQSGSLDLEDLGSRLLSPPAAAYLSVSGMFSMWKEPRVAGYGREKVQMGTLHRGSRQLGE